MFCASTKIPIIKNSINIIIILRMKIMKQNFYKTDYQYQQILISTVIPFWVNILLKSYKKL